MPPITGDTSSSGPVLMSAPIPESRPMSRLSLWSHFEFIVVVSDPNLRLQIFCRDSSAVAGQVEMKKGAARQEEQGGAHEQVTEEGGILPDKMERVFKVNAWMSNYCSA